MAVQAIPDGYHSVTPMLLARQAAGLIDFIKRAFGAEERMRVPGPEEGSVGHCELTIGDSVVMVSDATPQFPANSVGIHLYVEDVDAVFKRAVSAGATTISEPADMFYGDRSGSVKDPSGNIWSIATHVEDVPEDELMKRMAELMPH